MARRPAALKHGLTSQYARADWLGEVAPLAEAILGAAPRDPSVLDAAYAAAEATLYLRRVQQCRLLILEDATLDRGTRTEAERSLAQKLSAATKCGDVGLFYELREQLHIARDEELAVNINTAAAFILEVAMSDKKAELRRLSNYERRAASARRKALRRLDYETIEADRRCIANKASSSIRPRAVFT